MIETKFWPASLEIPLLRAAFLSNEAGIQAWERWRSQVNMDDLPHLGSFRLLPQLYRNLQSLGIDDLMMMKLKGIARRNWYKNQRFFHSVGPLLRALHEVGIECMLLDGPALALEYYSEYALGSDTTLAILVPTQQVGQAITVLQTMGWQPERKPHEALIEPDLAAGWMRCYRDATGRTIHLHWHLFPEFRETEADSDFWCGAVVTGIHDVPIRILNPADQALYSCVEDISTPKPYRFLRAIDVMFIIKAAPDLDWERLITQAEKHRLAVPLLAVLRYIQDNLDEPLPPAVLQRLQSLELTWQDRLEYRLKTSGPSIWRRFWQLWFDYRRHTSSISLANSLLGFPRYLQHFWGLTELKQVPGKALSILRQRSRRKFPFHREAGH